MQEKWVSSIEREGEGVEENCEKCWKMENCANNNDRQI